MTKEKFRYLYSFKYNNKEYIYLISKNYPFYFLEYNISTNKFYYPDINTFQELFQKFYNNNKLAFDIKSSLNIMKENLHNRVFKLTPLIKTTSGLLSIVMALSVCGCTQITTDNNSSTTSYVETVDKNKEINDYFKKYNIEVVNREYDGNDYIFAKDFVNNDNKHQITIQDFDEFRKLNNLDFIPNWDNIIEVFKSNENIDNEKKEIILESINNLKNNEEFKDIDLSVLYVNAKRMKFKYLSTDEMKNSLKRESVYAYFNSDEGIVYLPKDKPLRKFELIHEVLGHGTLNYRKETDSSLIVFDCTNYIMLPTDNTYSGYSMGVMISEGGANMIAHFATKDYSTSTFYELYEEELRVIAKLCNVSIGKLLNHKGISFYDFMYQNNINTPVEYIFKMDALYNGQLYCEFSDLMERLFVDATEEKFINSNNHQQNKIIKETMRIINKSHLNKNELHFDYADGSINYNLNEAANKYKENMSKLKK